MSTQLQYTQRGSRDFNAILFALFLAGFAIFSSLYCVQPMMPFVAEYYGISAAQSSLPLSVSTIALAVGLLFSGVVSDQIGRKPMMLLALLLSSILLIVISLFHHWTLFLVLRIFVGLSVSGVAAVTMTYIGEEIAKEDIGFAMGLYISGTAIGGMGGRLIAGLALDYMQWYQVILLIGILNLCIAGLFYLYLPASKHFTATKIRFNFVIRSLYKALHNQVLVTLFILGFILMGCFVSVFNYISYHLLHAPFNLSQSLIGLISLAYLSGIYSSPQAAIWATKIGRYKVIVRMLCLMLLGLGLMLFQQIYLLLIGLLLFTFAFFAAHATASSWVSSHSVQAGAMGSSLYLFCYYLGSSVLGSGSGMIWQSTSWSGLITFLSIFILAALLCTQRLKKVMLQSV